MQARTPFERWARWVFALAFALRLSLALINMDAFDPHIPVVKAIAYEHRIPGKDDMWEGFQPKLWYATVAMILQVVPTHNIKDITRIAQGVNVIAGMATLWLIFLFLRRLEISDRAKLIAFSLIALNPMLIGIDAQATNDSFVILFSTLALYFGVQFFEKPAWRSFGFMTLGAVLAVLSKGNALAPIIAILCTFAATALVQSERRNLAWASRAVLLVALVVGTMATLAPYGENWARYGSPFVTNMPPDPVPAQFFAYAPTTDPQHYVEGVRTGFGWLFTFRIFDMLRWPHMHDGPSLFRTSLWSVLYGEWNFVHLDRWPYFWDDDRNGVMWLGRGLLLLALLPAGIFLVSLFRQSANAVCFFRDRSQWDAARILLVLSVLGQFAFVAIYSYRGRLYEFAKAIFLLPALLGITWLFALGVQRFEQRFQTSRIRFLLTAVTVLLLIGYVADITVVIVDQWMIDPRHYWG
jgi:hypothetical protein